MKSCNDKIDKIEKKMLILDEEGETHESNSDFGRQQKEKVEEIEEILRNFLPAEEGYQKGIMEP